jgi:hypothetical protein
MKSTINLYIFSFITLILQLLFLAIIKEFETDFIDYIEVITINQIFVSFIGSIQFYLKEKSNNIEIIFSKLIVLLLIISLMGLIIYYLYFKFYLFIFFLSSLVSMISYTYTAAYFARFNKFNQNTFLLFVYSLIKFMIIYFSYKFNLNIIWMLTLSNIIIFILCFKFVRKIRIIIKEKGNFSVISIMNNILGTGSSTLDKLYVTNYLTAIAANYFIIFRIASVTQYLTEVLYRRERFIITEGKFKINIKNIYMKFFFIGLIIFLVNILIKEVEPVFLNLGFSLNQFVHTLVITIFTYIDSICIISLAFLVNSLSGLDYDKIYRNFGNKKLFTLNFFNIFFLIILLYVYGKSILSLSLVFLAVHIFNYIYTKILNIYLFSNVKFKN